MDLKTVGELIDFLSTQPRDWLVVLASDGEGNSHSPLAAADEAMYVPFTTWSGDVHPTGEWLDAAIADPDLSRQGWSEEDRAPEDAEHVVVLHPTN